MKRKKIGYLVVMALLVTSCGINGNQPEHTLYKSQALQVLAEEMIQDVELEPEEIKLIEYPDGSAIKFWVIEEAVHNLESETTTEPIHKGRKTACVAIKDVDSKKFGLTLKLQVDYQYGGGALKVVSYDAWAETLWSGYETFFDRSRSTIISSYNSCTATTYFCVKYENINAGQIYTLAPNLQMRLACEGDQISMGGLDIGNLKFKK